MEHAPTQVPISGFELLVQRGSQPQERLVISKDGSGCQTLGEPLSTVCLMATNVQPDVIGGAAFGKLNDADTPSLTALIWRARIDGDVSVCQRGGLTGERRSRCERAARDPNYAAVQGDITVQVPAGGPIQSPVSGLVPWVDRAAASLAEPSQSPQPVADAPACRASDLHAQVGPIGVGLGNTVLPVTFFNISSTACTLIGYPSLMGITLGGAPESIPVGHGSYFGDPGPAANLAPNGIGFAVVNISGADACQAALSGRHTVYQVLRIGLPAGGSVDVDGSTFDTICGVFASLFGVPAAASPPEALPPSTLSAEISAPASVAPGTMLRYVVTITNATDADYSLVPCPVYEQFVGSGTGTTSGTTWIATVLDGYLNCDTVRAIPAHGAVSYEMRLAIPENQPAGAAKFGWDLLGDRGPWANALLQVQPGG